MTIKLVKRPPDGVELRLEGRLDTTTSPAAQEAFLKVPLLCTHLLIPKVSDYF